MTSGDSTAYSLTYIGLARFIAFSFALLWGVDSSFDLASLRWLNSILIFSFVFLFVIRRGFSIYISAPFFLLLSLFPSVIASVDPVYSFAQFLRFSSVVLFCFFVGELPPRSRLKILSSAVCCVVMLTIVSVILIPFISEGSLEGGDRVRYSGVFYHANIAGFCSGMVVLFAIYHMLFRGESSLRILFVLGVMFSGFWVLMLSDSRSALVAVFVGALVLFSAKLKGRYSIRPVLAVSLLTFSFAPLLLVVWVDSISLGDNPYNASMLERFYLWNWSFSMFDGSKFFGGGFGLPLFTGEISWNGDLVSYPYAHNIILNVLAWSGFSGLVYLGGVFFVVLRSSMPLTNSGPSSYVFPGCLILYVFTWSLLDGALQGMWITHLVFWLSVSCLLGVGNNLVCRQK